MTAHWLELNVSAPVVLLRNLAPAEGLCDGTRLIITRMSGRVLEARIMGGDHDGDLCFIPRIFLESNKSTGLPFILRRLQFPIRPAFVMTINKAQGQSLSHVGIYLEEPVFAHGATTRSRRVLTRRSPTARPSMPTTRPPRVMARAASVLASF
jgi:ATP-dependent DNA helicase PIF1